jgi:hypothetical protein
MSGYDVRMKPPVYLETTIPSYLTAWPSRDLRRVAHQQSTKEWWEFRRGDFELFVSQVVLDECAAGDAAAAASRLEAIRDIALLEASPEAAALTQSLLREVPLPARAAADAAHIAIAAVSGMDYLLTWNCRHIANAALLGPIEAVCRSHGFAAPRICTPDQLLEAD